MFTRTPEQARALFVGALRSGEYEQGFGSLRPNDDCYCALGVACDVYRKHVGGEWKKHKDGEGYRFDTRLGGIHGKASALLPGPVQVWYGFTNDIPTSPAGNIADFNDVSRTPFAEIAGMIEEGYFLVYA